MKKKNRFFDIALIFFIMMCVVGVIAVGRSRRNKTGYTKTGFVMGTVLTITVYGEQGKDHVKEIEKLLTNLEQDSISWRFEGSEVYNINHCYQVNVPYRISDELAEYMKLVNEVNLYGNNLLDCNIRPLAALWGIEDGKTRVPSEEEIQQAVRSVKQGKMHLHTDDDGSYLIFEEEQMSLDLGAVGKGIGCDVVEQYLKESNLSGALVAVGGSIVCYGTKPDHTKYKVGIRNPREGEASVMGHVEIDASKKPVFVSTSGDYEKYFIQDGKRYHHILNPETGYPAQTGTISATVVCENGELSDALSTLCILLKRDEALQLLWQFDAEGILIDEEKNVYVTEGLKNSFQITEDSFKLWEKQ